MRHEGRSARTRSLPGMGRRGVSHMFSTNHDMILSRLSRFMRSSVVFLGQAVAYCAAFALGDNQIGHEQVAEVALEGALGCPIDKEGEQVAWGEHATGSDAL